MVLEKYKNDEKKLKICVDAVSLLRGIQNTLDGCFDWNLVPAKSNYEECPGAQNLNWDGTGYKTILDIMLKIYPHRYPGVKTALDKIWYDKTVTKINYRQHSGNVTVGCSDGTKYKADHVIFTPSLGVLKHDSDTMFNPPLSKDKRDCIRTLGFDAVMKIPMLFRNKWWQSEFKGFSFIWSAEDKINIVREFDKGPTKDGKSWIIDLMSVLPAENNSNVMIAWVTGDFIPELETTSYDIIKEGIVFTLKKFLGHMYNITEPDEITYSEWYTNPHFRGTYSYETLESRKLGPSCNDVLAETIWHMQRPVLLFAGEATNRIHYGTVHGAIETGYREANRLLTFYGINHITSVAKLYT